MAVGSLASHRVTYHGRAADERWSLEALATGGKPQTYRMAFPNQWRAAELSSGGMPRPGRDKNGDTGALFQPACPGYRDHIGGGKPPTPKLLTMRHAGPMEGAKR